MGATPGAGLEGVRLLMLGNDWSLRNLIPAELAKGFGFVQSKPASALSPEDLAAAARAEGLEASTAPDVSAAVALALDMEGPPPRVVICGGLHFAGEVLALSPETWPT